MAVINEINENGTPRKIHDVRIGGNGEEQIIEDIYISSDNRTLFFKVNGKLGQLALS